MWILLVYLQPVLLNPQIAHASNFRMWHSGIHSCSFNPELIAHAKRCHLTVLISLCISFQDQLELSIREKSGLHETERQLHLKIKTLQSCLKTEKDEVSFYCIFIMTNTQVSVFTNCASAYIMHEPTQLIIQSSSTGSEAPEYHCQPGLSVQPWCQEKRERSCKAQGTPRPVTGRQKG